MTLPKTWEQYQKWYIRESIKQYTIAFLLLTAFAFGLLVAGCSVAGAQDWTDNQIVNAIYKAEGVKSKHPFGILSVSCSGYDDCRKICYNTVRNNRKRFANQKKYKDFIEFLGSRYCPTAGNNLTNDEKRLNIHWIKNVKYFLANGENNENRKTIKNKKI